MACYPDLVSICPACERQPFRDGGLVELLQRALGARWWAVSDIGEACAELVVVSQRAWKDGLQICDRHLAMFATFAQLRIADEVQRRAVPAGCVLALHGEIYRDKQEKISREEAARDGVRIIGTVRRFVAGSALAGVVEIDARDRQARITLQIAGSDPLRWLVIEHARLAKLSALDVVTGLGHSSAV